jgi:hypothetical protein
LTETRVVMSPNYPAYAFAEGEGVPKRAPFPAGSPAASLAAQIPGINLLDMEEQKYSKEMTVNGKGMWRLVAVGWK